MLSRESESNKPMSESFPLQDDQHKPCPLGAGARGPSSRPAAVMLDVRGLKCPLPALLARRALARSPAGQAIDILADDPVAPIDVPHMCAQEGYEVMEIERQGPMARMRLRSPV